LVTLGIPEDVLKSMMKVVKKTHEAYSLKEATDYWISNSPRFLSRHHAGWCRFQINETLSFPQTRINVFNRRKTNTIEFKKEWRLRSIEERQKKVIDWCKFGDQREQQRHQQRLKGIRKKRKKLENSHNCYGEEYIDNLWKSWEAGASSYYFVGQNRRTYISKWYEGIHPGRFFLFYKENKIIQERNKGVPRGPCEDGYQYPQTPIFDKGPYEQLIEDLRCIDGPGLGESGTKVEHIDDLFLH
tara:strand:- start:821 stop:1549 length:729 start_codon:yes stop_codon:yes gene_type:complete